jgi:hypothetical protein
MLIVRAFPVRSRAAVDDFAAEMRARAAEARRFYESYGITREAWFFQRSSYGDIVIGVTEADEPALSRAQQYAASREELSTWFKERVKDITGIDPNVEPLGPPTDQLFDSAGGGDLEWRVPLVVRAYALKTREALEDFVDDLHKRPDETREMYQRFNAREIWFVQATDRGPMAIAVAAMPDPEKTAREYAKAIDRFAIWFKQRVEDVSGVNPNRTPLGPETDLVYDYARSG